MEEVGDDVRGDDVFAGQRGVNGILRQVAGYDVCRHHRHERVERRHVGDVRSSSCHGCRRRNNHLEGKKLRIT